MIYVKARQAALGIDYRFFRKEFCSFFFFLSNNSSCDEL